MKGQILSQWPSLKEQLQKHIKASWKPNILPNNFLSFHFENRSWPSFLKSAISSLSGNRLRLLNNSNADGEILKSSSGDISQGPLKLPTRYGFHSGSSVLNVPGDAGDDYELASPPGRSHPGYYTHHLPVHEAQPQGPSAVHVREAREAIRAKEGLIIDMDGVIYHGNKILPGVVEFVEWLQENEKRFLFLTNSSDKTPEELQQKLARLGIDVESSHFYTSALATAAFLSSQRPGGTAYVIGEPGLLQALYSVGYSMNDVNPDYVIVGETPNYTYEKIEHAVHCILNGAKLIGTNCDKTDPSPSYPGEVIPAAGSLITPIEKASGVNAYFVGKPNPLMMRSALAALGVRRRDTIIIGDRMDTDVLGGLEASIDSCLVLSGVTSLKDMRQYSFMPRFVLRGLVDLVPSNTISDAHQTC